MALPDFSDALLQTAKRPSFVGHAFSSPLGRAAEPMISRLLRRVAKGAVVLVLLAFPVGGDMAGAQSPDKRPAGPVKDPRSLVDPHTLGLVAGAPGLTEAIIGSDIAKIVASGQETGPNGEVAVRVLPMVGNGGIQDVRDMLTLPGTDLAIVPTAILERLLTSDEFNDVRRKLTFVSRLYVQELHIVAGRGTHSLRDLAGKVVNLGEDSGIDSLVKDLFEALEIKTKWVKLGQREALEQVHKGEIAATIFISGKPVGLLAGYRREDGLRLLPVPEFSTATSGYLPASFVASDYPNLLEAHEQIDTVAVSSVLLARDWPAGSSRHRLLTEFIRLLFPKVSGPPREDQHPKWKEINLSATFPGWTRSGAAERWLDQQARADSKRFFDTFDATGVLPPNRSERDRLFEEFLRWRKQGKTSP